MRQLDPIRWSAPVAWSVLAVAIAAIFVALWFVDEPWLFRLGFFGGFVVGAVVWLRSSGVHLRDVAILVMASLAALVFFRYFTDRPISVIGQGIAFSIPWLIGIGVGRNFVLGTLAPGRYSSFAPADAKIATAFERSWTEIGNALRAKNEQTFRAYVESAKVLGNVDTFDPDWIEVREGFLAYATYLGKLDASSENAELHRLGDASVEKLRDVIQRRRVWFGRLGRPGTSAATGPTTP